VSNDPARTLRRREPPDHQRFPTVSLPHRDRPIRENRRPRFSSSSAGSPIGNRSNPDLAMTRSMEASIPCGRNLPLSSTRCEAVDGSSMDTRDFSRDATGSASLGSREDLDRNHDDILLDILLELRPETRVDRTASMRPRRSIPRDLGGEPNSSRSSSGRPSREDEPRPRVRPAKRGPAERPRSRATRTKGARTVRTQSGEATPKHETERMDDSADSRSGNGRTDPLDSPTHRPSTYDEPGTTSGSRQHTPIETTPSEPNNTPPPEESQPPEGGAGRRNAKNEKNNELVPRSRARGVIAGEIGEPGVPASELLFGSSTEPHRNRIPRGLDFNRITRDDGIQGHWWSFGRALGTASKESGVLRRAAITELLLAAR
jgi:hypothetical protein